MPCTNAMHPRQQNPYNPLEWLPCAQPECGETKDPKAPLELIVMYHKPYLMPGDPLSKHAHAKRAVFRRQEFVAMWHGARWYLWVLDL